MRISHQHNWQLYLHWTTFLQITNNIDSLAVCRISLHQRKVVIMMPSKKVKYFLVIPLFSIFSCLLALFDSLFLQPLLLHRTPLRLLLYPFQFLFAKLCALFKTFSCNVLYLLEEDHVHVFLTSILY
jgi:hypothetical protein